MHTRKSRQGLLFLPIIILAGPVLTGCEEGLLLLNELRELERTGEVTVTPLDASLGIGETRQFEVEVRDENGALVDDPEVAWRSQSPDVAEIEEPGRVRGLSEGAATIEAVSGGIVGRATLNVRPTPTQPGVPGTVRDLRVLDQGSRSLRVAFTQVDDGTGNPAHYRLRYARPASDLAWPDDFTTVDTGECASPVQGTGTQGTFECEVPGLVPETEYELGVIAYRYDSGGSRVFGQPSNRARGTTEPRSSGGLWIGRSTLAALPTSGPAWDNVKSRADGSCPSFQISDQDNNNNTCIMAKALVYARTGQAAYRSDVVRALRSLADMGTYDGRALALGRNLGAYAIAADLIDLRSVDPDLDRRVRSRFRQLLTTPTWGAASNLVDCHERRPNNWGTHCGGARTAVAAYLGDKDELDRAARVFRGWLGHRPSYSGFQFGGPASSRDHSWECDQSRPVGINPRGCRKEGRNLDGVVPDDQRRGGSFDANRWPPPRELYVWEALQGAMMQAVILDQAGYPAFEWEDRALLRAVTWLHEVSGYPADRGNTWQPHLVNHYYGTSFAAPVPTRVGKNVGWADWTHR